MARTQAGKLRHLVDFQKDIGAAVNSRGHTTADWVTQFRGYCQLEPLTGNELVVQKQIHSTVTHKIVTRCIQSATPQPTWRVKYGSRLFHVESILNVDERNEYWEMIATELPSVA
jgi:SPP1 family predicted phage head-tail adaptor